MSTPTLDLTEDLAAALERERSSPRLSRSTVPAALLVPPSVPRLLRLTLEEWAWICGALAGMWLGPGWLYPLWALLIAGRLHALAVVLHDLCHLPLRRRTWRHLAIEALAGFPVGITLDAMRAHHLRHHRDNALPEDPYYWPLGGHPRRWVAMWVAMLLLPAFWTSRAVVGALALLFPALRTGYGRVYLGNFRGESLREDRETRTCALAELRQLAAQGLVAAATLAWPEVMLYSYFVPLLVTATVNGQRFLTEHTYLPARDRRPESIVATTRNAGTSWLHRWLLAPRNIGFHVVHHLHPQVSLEHLPRLQGWYAHAWPELFGALTPQSPPSGPEAPTVRPPGSCRTGASRSPG
jgi:fatty acid desaturase